jgi:HD-GYP domain-containing protein (c-di-GMP phosphodiesterase class II)
LNLGGVLVALAEALESRDAYSGAHSLRVATLAGTVGERLGWDEARLTRLRVGALLHDVGKLAIPERILRKPGPLTSAELDRVRYHPVAGARFVKALAPDHATLACALYHHERWDGDGYPLGRSGSRIPAEARVLAVVDAFDAMTFGRPFRRPLTVEAALAELDRCAGTQFEPAIVSAFVEACDAGAVDLRRRAS